jgi:hypothetical protein
MGDPVFVVVHRNAGRRAASQDPDRPVQSDLDGLDLEAEGEDAPDRALEVALAEQPRGARSDDCHGNGSR